MNAAPSATLNSVRCPKCSVALGGPYTNEHGSVMTCFSCGSALGIYAFPAINLAAPKIQAGEQALEGESACFFHPEKRAAASCDRCGRFLCALCDLPFAGGHLCPNCITSGIEKRRLPEFVDRRVVWGQISFLTGMLPLIFCFCWPFYIGLGPAAMAAGIFGWNKPGSLVHGRRRVMAVFGIVLGLVQLGVMGALVFAIWRGARRG